MKQLFYSFFLMLVFISVSNAQPGLEPDTIFVSAGWNLIGSKFSGAVSDIVITEPPGIISSPFYKYSPQGGYSASDTLEKSSGYWVKISDPQTDGPFVLILVPYFSWTWTCGHPLFGKVFHGGLFDYYNSVQIGSQCWLRENLDVGTKIPGSENQINNGVTEKYCWGDSEPNCVTYGGLYQWNEAMKYVTTPGAQGICPNGWHIPTYQEFLILKANVSDDGNALKAIGQGSGSGAGTNTSGFSALLSGARNTGGTFGIFGRYAFFWSSSEYSTSSAIAPLLSDVTNTIYSTYYDKTYGFSIRCLKD